MERKKRRMEGEKERGWMKAKNGFGRKKRESKRQERGQNVELKAVDL